MYTTYVIQVCFSLLYCLSNMAQAQAAAFFVSSLCTFVDFFRMATEHEIGTPLSGEHKQRRLHSPLQEMDYAPMTCGFMRQPEFDVEPQTPERATPVTLESIGALLRGEINPVMNTITNLERQMATMNLAAERRFSAIESKIADSTARIQKLEDSMAQGATPRSDDSLWSKLTLMEQEIASLKTSGDHAEDGYCRERTVIIGGLGTLSSVEEAKKWITDQLWHLYGPQPGDIFTKGDFKSVIFAKFASKGQRDTAANLLQKARMTEGGSPVWARPDHPLEMRVLRSLVFGTKYVMKQWGYSGLWADAEEGTGVLWYGSDLVFSVKIVDRNLSIDYGPGWEEFLNDDGFPDFTDKLAALNNKLQQARPLNKGVPKGTGKGSEGKAGKKGAGR